MIARLLRRLNVPPAVRARLARIAMVVALVLWPIDQVWNPTNEPPFILFLSWFAIVLTLADLSATTDVREHAGPDDQPEPAIA